MGPRIREDTDWGGRGRGGWVAVCASARRGGTPILAFPREGGREGGGMGKRRRDGGGA